MFILDTRFDLVCDDPALLDYSRAFAGAYVADIAPVAAARVVTATIERGAVSCHEGRAVPVHRSKHAYWTFSAHLVSERPRRLVWPSHGIAVTVAEDASRITIEVAPGKPAATTGEAVFHVCRSLALYLRDASAGVLLHASAVEVAGGAVMFVGSVLAGKTTLLTEAVIAHGARPLSNDRVWLLPGAEPVAVSWPSYASYCEGTLLNYPALERAAARYEEPDYPLRTQTWPDALRPEFAKDRKRVYPMSWFTEATGAGFVHQAPLRALALTRLSPDVVHSSLVSVDLADDAERSRLSAELQAQCFEGAEPSFLPWHGLGLPAGAVSVPELVAHLIDRNVPVFALAANPSDLSPVKELLWTVRRSATTSS